MIKRILRVSTMIVVIVILFAGAAFAESIKVTFWLKWSDGKIVIPREEVTVGSGATARDVVLRSFKTNGYTALGPENYISGVIDPYGTELSEKDQGSNSGWMYMVNKVTPNVGANDYSVKNGDDILLYYVKDWMNDPETGEYIDPSGDDSSDSSKPKDDDKDNSNADTGDNKSTGGDGEKKEGEKNSSNKNSSSSSDDKNSTGSANNDTKYDNSITPSKSTVNKEAKVSKDLSIKAGSISTTAKTKKRTMTVRWKKVKGATNYRIAYRQAGAKKWKYKWSNGKNSVTITKMKKNGLYDFRLQAVKKSGSTWTKSKWSKINRRFFAITGQKVSPGRKKITVTVGKVKGASGFEVIYSLKKKMELRTVVEFKGGKKTKLTIRKLKSKKTYFVRTRPFKVYKGHRYIGVMSGPKKVKIK